MHCMLKIASVFLLSLLAMTIVCTVVWQQFVTDVLYHCTDAMWLDYLFPGHWVHNPMAVAHVVPSRSMSEPDTIRAGWSISSLWGLWCLFFGASVVVSILMARLSRRPKRQAGEVSEQHHAVLTP